MKSSVVAIALTTAACSAASVSPTLASEADELSALIPERAQVAPPRVRMVRTSHVSSAYRQNSGLPTFHGSFETGGTAFPYTMVGGDPRRGGETRIDTVLVPLTFVFDGQGASGGPLLMTTLDAVGDILRSPAFTPAPFANGFAQAADAAQRASFAAVEAANWHTTLRPSRIESGLIHVPADRGAVLRATDGHVEYARVDSDYLAQEVNRLLDRMHLHSDVLPIFVSHNVVAQILGEDGSIEAVAFSTTDAREVDDNGRRSIQTQIWTSWIDAPELGTIFADSSELTGALASWMMDPFFENLAPEYDSPEFPGLGLCHTSLGDPFILSPTPITVGGRVFQVEAVPMLSWFAREIPSTAFGDAYSWPDETVLTGPSLPCSP
jgi:hypothetical protein